MKTITVLKDDAGKATTVKQSLTVIADLLDVVAELEKRLARANQKAEFALTGVRREPMKVNRAERVAKPWRG